MANAYTPEAQRADYEKAAELERVNRMIGSLGGILELEAELGVPLLSPEVRGPIAYLQATHGDAIRSVDSHGRMAERGDLYELDESLAQASQILADAQVRFTAPNP
jgi:hypothetical protein